MNHINRILVFLDKTTLERDFVKKDDDSIIYKVFRAGITQVILPAKREVLD